MAKFKEEDINVFKKGNLTVVQTDPETIKIEDKEVTVMIRDVRGKPLIDIVIYILGVINGVLISALALQIH